MHFRFSPAAVVIWLCVLGATATAQEAADSIRENQSNGRPISGAAAEISAAAQSYAAAFNARDTEQLVAHWSPDGVYTNRTSGEQVVGHDAMASQFKTIFESDSVPTLAVATESVDFISPNVALERGTATVTYAEDDIVESRYSVVYVRRNGKWLIDRVTEDEIAAPHSNYERLKDLDWLIGEWVDKIGDVSVEMECRWTRNKNYMSRTYAISNGDQLESSGLQIIGWDPVKHEIRSWLFDSDGGFVTGIWTKRSDRWVVQSVATLADGGQGSFTSIFRPLEDGSFAWQKVNQVVDGELLPNIDEVIIRRKRPQGPED